MTGQHGVWPTAVAWYQRFRKAVAAVLAIAAVPGVLGVLEAIGLHLSAGTWATILGVAGVVVGGGTVAAVPNALSDDDLTKAAAARGLSVIPDPPRDLG
ncbi:hypothetical protein [Amycolatopsis kentuckyensis]|uniref:hypothetical protein n=1 Tax=Amycolatopsis kentuckyensis TaxID=218823 RepID=UPI003561C36C